MDYLATPLAYLLKYGKITQTHAAALEGKSDDEVAAAAGMTADEIRANMEACRQRDEWVASGEAARFMSARRAAEEAETRKMVNDQVDDMLASGLITDKQAARLRTKGPKQVEAAYVRALTNAWVS